MSDEEKKRTKKEHFVAIKTASVYRNLNNVAPVYTLTKVYLVFVLLNYYIPETNIAVSVSSITCSLYFIHQNMYALKQTSRGTVSLK